MAYNLRLPPALDAEARARCERLGISLNALLCVALDAYLRGPQPSETSIVTGAAGPEPDGASRAAPARQVVQPDIPKLTKDQRREITRLDRLARKGKF